MLVTWTPMVTQARDDTAVERFADSIGEWLLTQRFGAITPLAFRHRLWESRSDDRIEGELPHVVIELLVEDPSPPPPQWRRPSEGEDLSLKEMQERAEAILWPRKDMDAVDKAARDRVVGLALPPGIDAHRPVVVHLFGRSEAKECGFPPRDD